MQGLSNPEGKLKDRGPRKNLEFNEKSRQVSEIKNYFAQWTENLGP